MKILFITNRFPYPPYQGDRLRAFHQLRILSQRHEVTLASPPPDREAEASIEAVRPLCFRMETAASPLWKQRFRLLQAPFSPLPLQTLYTYDPALEAVVRRLTTETRFDVVHLQLIRLAPIAPVLAGLPTVIDLIDALSLNMGRRVQRERGMRRALIASEADRLRRAEQEALKRFDRLIVCSPVDREAVGAADHLHIVPNGVEIQPTSSHSAHRDPMTLIFTGRMSYHPNVDAVHGFVEEIWPLIRARIPQARFQIVGADPAPSILKLNRQQGIEVTGRVPDIADYLRRATAAVAPLRSGSGIQNKVLEAMAAGAPVVATPYALGGIAATHGEHLLSASQPAEFAEQVIRLLNNPALARHLACSALDLVEQHYTWERSAALLEQIYDLALPAKRQLQAA